MLNEDTYPALTPTEEYIQEINGTLFWIRCYDAGSLPDSENTSVPKTYEQALARLIEDDLS